MNLTKHQDKVLLDLWRQIILLKADNRCELCGRKDHKLDPHHIFGRRSKSTRYDPDNGIALCAFGCHTYGRYSAHESPEWFRNWLMEHRGKEWFQGLYLKSRYIIRNLDYKMTKFSLQLKLKELEK